MSSKLWFDVISNAIHQQTTLEHLSGRDRVELLRALLDNLGILERFAAEADQTARAQQILVEQFDKHWGAQ